MTLETRLGAFATRVAGEVKRVRTESVDATAIVRASAVETWGHSYAFGIGASDKGKRFGSIIGRALNLPEVNEAISGSTITFHNSGGAWPKVLQQKRGTGEGAVPGSAVTATQASGFSGPHGLHINMVGINDLNSRGNTAEAMAGFKHDLRTIISRMRAAVVWESDSAVFGFPTNRGWTTNADTVQNSGANYRYTTSTTPDSFTVTLPADFPGGTIALGFTAQAAGGVAYGAVYSTTIAGTTYTFDARNPHTVAGSYTGMVWRLPALPAGAQTLTISYANVSGLAIVDYVQWEGKDEPLVVLVEQPLPVDYSAYGSTAPGPPTDAGVGVLNTILRELAAEFGPRVITVDTSVMNKDASMFTADKLHPSDKGNATIAALVLARLASFRITALGTPRRTPRVDYGTAIPTSNHTFYSLGDQIINTAPSASAPLGWVCIGEGRPGTWAPFGLATIAGVDGLQAALDARVAKPAAPTVDSVLTQTATGLIGQIQVTASSTANAIVRRGSDSSVTVGLTPTATGHASSKKYTDESDAATLAAARSFDPLPMTRTAYNQLGVRENRLYPIMPEGWVAA